MNKKQKIEADGFFLLLAGLFIAALITCNLIANKFVAVDLGFKTFIISAGILPYPVTFLITDILSEIYGRRKTTMVVVVGFMASVFTLWVLMLGGQFSAIEGSPVGNAEYDNMFGNSWRVVGASMIAYLAAQLIDVRVFHFWKKLTKGKHLWLRNNGSTIISQLLDTTLVVMVLFFGVKSFGAISSMILDGWMFKVLCALLDTPIFYVAVWIIKKHFRLKPVEELAY